MLDLQQLKRTAEGRWPEVVCRIAGLNPDVLDGKHHPCPKCGGTDRFRAIDLERGALFCNACFNKGNGDGIAAVMWLTGLSFPDATAQIAEHLGLACQRAEVDVIEEMAWRKGVSADVLRRFGATRAQRGDLTVCRIPMWDASLQKTGDFDLAPLGDFDKGKMAHGSRHGIFLAETPSAGDTILVVEGVKDAAAVTALGFKAVGLPTCRMDAAFARLLRGCHAVIIPDRDKAGLEGARETAGRLFGVAASVKIAELPAEYRETGGPDVRDVLKTRDGETKVRDAIKNAKPWLLAGGPREIKLVLLREAVLQVITDQGTKEALLSLGLPEVDWALSGGVLPGEMIIIAGRPSHGKTTVALQALNELAKQVPALMISEEMAMQALGSRMLCGLTELVVEQWAFHKDALTAEADRHFNARQPIVVVESCGTVERAVEAIAKAHEELRIGAAAVDYLQILRGQGESRYAQVTDVSMRLKQAAVQYGIVLLAVCQLNRQQDSRQTSSPRMSDLRDSGQLEQDADVILFVEWPYRTKPDAHRETEYRIYVGKNRNRAIRQGVIDCIFRPERQRLYGLSRREDAPAAKQAKERYGEFDQFAR